MFLKYDPQLMFPPPQLLHLLSAVTVLDLTHASLTCVALPVRVGHRLFLIAQTRLLTNQLVVEQLVQPLPDQVPGAHQEVTECTEGLVY